jgi:hypothetical protein
MQVGDVVTTRECELLVERVAGSQELRRAARLREFLVYVCQQTLEQKVPTIHEQEIGMAVFGRPESYDTNIDNIVRVNATALRKRLEHYFAEEGAQEEIVIEIPRGSYMPVFRRRPGAVTERIDEPQGTLPEMATGEVEAQMAPVTTSLPVTSAARSYVRVWQMCAALLAVACGVLMWQNRLLDRQVERWTADPGLKTFWGEFFGQGRQTDVLVADTSFALAEDFLQRTIPLNDYVNYNYKQTVKDPALSDDHRKDLGMVLERNNGSIGDFEVAQQILALDRDPQKVQLKFARDFTTDEAKANNLVLIGSTESNPWVNLFADRLNFALQYDPTEQRAYVTNRAPQAGEAAEYATPKNGKPAATGYGVIAYVPNVNGKGKALILEGTDSQATGAAGEFVTNEDAMAAFESKFPRGQVPSFEILLRTTQLSGTPLRAEIAAYRIYPVKATAAK